MVVVKFRGLELWDVDDVPTDVRDEATAAALAVLDAQAVSPIEARFAQFNLEAMDDRGQLDDGADLAAGGVDETHLKAGRRAQAAAAEVIQRLAPNRAAPYLIIGVEQWALDQYEAFGADPTKLP
jgi:hypothetical protein